MTLPPLPVEDEDRLIPLKELAKRWCTTEDDLRERIRRGYLISGAIAPSGTPFQFHLTNEGEEYVQTETWEVLIQALNEKYKKGLQTDEPLVLCNPYRIPEEKTALHREAFCFLSDTINIKRPINFQNKYTFPIRGTLSSRKDLNKAFMFGIPREEVYKAEFELGIIPYGEEAIIDEDGNTILRPVRYCQYQAVGNTLHEKAHSSKREAPREKTHLSGDNVPAPKTRNSYLRMINALCEALINGRTGKPHSDAEAIFTLLDQKGIDCKLTPKTLGNYLSEYDKIVDD